MIQGLSQHIRHEHIRWMISMDYDRKMGQIIFCLGLSIDAAAGTMGLFIPGADQ